MLIPIDFSAVWQSAKNNKGKIIIFVLAGVLLLLAMFFTDRCGTWSYKHFEKKKKAEIANTVAQIKEVQSEIAQERGDIRELEGKKQVLKEQLTTQTAELANLMSLSAEQHEAVNQAQANYNAALRANTNVNATAQDLQDQIDKLESMK